MARVRIAEYLGAARNEIVFQKNTTEAINLVAQSFVSNLIEPGDKILLTGLEHHANLVSWQLLAARTGAELVFSQVDEDGCFDEQHWLKLLISGVRFAAFTAVSNVTGERFPIEEMLAAASARSQPPRSSPFNVQATSTKRLQRVRKSLVEHPKRLNCSLLGRQLL
jgi:cysteine desulfurase/selenocysteine lyase